MNIVPDALIKRAEDSFTQSGLSVFNATKTESFAQRVLSYQQHCRWIPRHLPQLCGPDGVFVSTVVFGKISKYSNSAWDKILPDVSEVNAYIKMQQDNPKPSPLVGVGLNCLFSIVPDESQQRALASKYSW